MLQSAVLPVPASVYGFAILFIGLLSGVIKLAHVQDTGKLLIEIMPVMFIPAGVGLLNHGRANLHLSVYQFP